MHFCYKLNNKPVFEFYLYLHDNIKYILIKNQLYYKIIYAIK